MSSSHRKKATGRWGLNELIAFECALAKDEQQDWDTLKQEDAELDLDEVARAKGDRRRLALMWLRHRLDRAPEIKLAADSVVQSLKLSGQLLGAGGMLLGLATATASLAYAGEAPINVSAFFGLFVLLQAALASLLLFVFLLPHPWRERLAFGPLFKLCRWTLNAILTRLQLLSGRFLSGKQRQNAAEWAGTASRSLALHGNMAKWMAFAKIQAAAFSFSVGALIALLVAVAFSDRAFGWQTTLEIGNGTVAELAKTVAIPWSWQWGEGIGYPSESQIAGSRIVLKEGIQELETSDLAAWWRFLAFGIMAYGLLPRLVFYGLGKWQLRSALARYDFRNASAERLLNRLAPNPSHFDAEKVQQGAERWTGTDSALGHGDANAVRNLCFLCSQELEEAFGLETLSRAIAHRWKLPETAVAGHVYSEGEMSAGLKSAEIDREIIVVLESWMPPIRELERQVRSLRESLGERVLIKLVLLGIPSEGEGVSLKPDKQYGEAWDSFARRMGDPYLLLENPAL